MCLNLACIVESKFSFHPKDFQTVKIQATIREDLFEHLIGPKIFSGRLKLKDEISLEQNETDWHFSFREI
jgi:hypothetical protein